jgi:hypothetical protein
MEKIRVYLRKEIITPVICIIFMTAYIVSALQMAPPLANRELQESFFPLLIYILGFPTALLLLYDGIKAVRSNKSEKGESEKKKVSKKPLLVALITVLLILTLKLFGFFISAGLFVFLFMLIYDDKPQQILRKLVYTVFIVGFVYILYIVIFDIRFPSFWS